MVLQQKQRTISQPMSRSRHNKKTCSSTLIWFVLILFVSCNVALLTFFWSSIQTSVDDSEQKSQIVAAVAQKLNVRKDSNVVVTSDKTTKEKEEEEDVMKLIEEKEDYHVVADDDEASLSKSGSVESVDDDKEGEEGDDDDDDDDVWAEIITLKTRYGPIRILLRPDFSEESVAYIRDVMQSNACEECHLYRAENDRGVLQGIIKSKSVPPNTVLGPCQREDQMKLKKKSCPPHDPNCGCHGPVMWKGAVAWAAGKGGPDFFIDFYDKEATWWGNQHTVWGMIKDDQSFTVIEKIFDLPKTKKGGLMMLDEKVDFALDIGGGIDDDRDD